MTRKGRWLCILFFVIILPLVVAQKIGDPYKILGVHRKASLPEIRKAYRQLAKEWYVIFNYWCIRTMRIY